MAIAVVTKLTGEDLPVVEWVRFLETPATPEKIRKKEKIRVADDDQRRVAYQEAALSAEIERWAPEAMGIEVYSVGRSVGGNAWKTTYSYQAALTLGRCRGLTSERFLPQDLKRAFVGSNKGGKVSVMSGVLRSVSGLETHLEEYAPGKWEHLSDAAGVAILALRRMGFS